MAWLMANSPLDRGALRQRFIANESTYGTFLGLGSPLAAEVVATSGVDWVLIDQEHGGGSEDQLGATIVAAGAYGVGALVRVESQERIRIGRALDAGAAGVMVPRIRSTAEAVEAVRHMSYPPVGDRGVATYNRSARWGKDLSVLESGRDAACIIQIETLEALSAVDDIARVEGADVLFVGPLDLSFALGVPRDFTHPVFVDACHKVLAAGKRENIVCGILAPDSTSARRYKDMGFTFIAVGSDSTLLSLIVTQEISQLKESAS
jgi:4-hydroxy-2-oxoheptanedioate aldolase